MKCPGCGYQRKFEDKSPEWQCPACEIVYSKHPNYNKFNEFKIKLLYKKNPKDSQIKRKIIYVYIHTYRLNYERLEFAYKSNDKIINRVELIDELGDMYSSIFSLAIDSNHELNDDQKMVIFRALTVHEYNDAHQNKFNTPISKTLLMKLNKILDLHKILIYLVSGAAIIFLSLYIFSLQNDHSYDEKFDQNTQAQIQLLTNEATHGNKEAQYTLARIYMVGLGIKPDKIKGIFWLTKSAENGNMNSQLWLGMITLYGEPTPYKAKKALYWINKSAAQGYEPALKILQSSIYRDLLKD